MDSASLYVTNVACELEDSKELKKVAIATVKATIVPDMEVPCTLPIEMVPRAEQGGIA